MTLLLAISVAVIFSVAFYLILGRELKEVAMGLFLVGHGAHLGIIAMSGQPLYTNAEGDVVAKSPPIVDHTALSAETLVSTVDPIPQALILTSIVISFAVMAFLLVLLVVTHRRVERLWLDDLAKEDLPDIAPAL